MSYGYEELMAAAADSIVERTCPKCKNPEFERVDEGAGEFLCMECKEQFDGAQALEVNFLLDALRIWNDREYDTPRFDHIHALAEHAQMQHMRIRELEEVLQAARQRLTDLIAQQRQQLAGLLMANRTQAEITQ